MMAKIESALVTDNSETVFSAESEDERQLVAMYNLSAGEGTLFAQYAIEMSERIHKMGPNPVKLARKNKAA